MMLNDERKDTLPERVRDTLLLGAAPEDVSVSVCVGMIRKIAGKYSQRCDIRALEDEGVDGLAKACEVFDASEATGDLAEAFQRFAWHRIRDAQKDFACRFAHPVPGVARKLTRGEGGKDYCPLNVSSKDNDDDGIKIPTEVARLAGTEDPEKLAMMSQVGRTFRKYCEDKKDLAILRGLAMGDSRRDVGRRIGISHTAVSKRIRAMLGRMPVELVAALKDLL